MNFATVIPQRMNSPKSCKFFWKWIFYVTIV